MTAALSITGIIAVLALVVIRINRQNPPRDHGTDRDSFTDSLLGSFHGGGDMS